MKLQSWRGLNRSIWSSTPQLRFVAGALLVLTGCTLLDLRSEGQPVALPIINVQPRCQFVSLAHPAAFSIIATNPAWVQIPVSSGDWNGSTNVVNTGQNFGTLRIDYNFYAIPDTLHVYYDNVRIFDSGLVSYSGTFWITYGPGRDDFVVLVMDEGGSPSTDTLWDYEASFSVPLSYQWQKDGTALALATNDAFQIPSVQTSDTGVYSVIVSNQVGTVTSSSVLLSLQPAPQLRIVLTSTNTVVVAWPAPSTNFVLLQADPLVPDTWATVPDTPDVVGNENQLIFDSTSDAQFFRLGIP